MRIIVALIITLFAELLLAQEPISIHLTEKEGLPTKESYSLLEDDEGFIWLAAEKGLFRYDGFEFKFYSHPEQVGLSVFSLTKDEENTIWYTNLASQIFCVKNDEVILFKSLKDFFKGNLARILVHKNRLYLSQVGKLIVLDKNTGEILFKSKKDKTHFHSTLIIKNDIVYSFNSKGRLFELDSNFVIKDQNRKVPISKNRHRRAYLKCLKNNLFLISFNNDGTSDKIIINPDLDKKFEFTHSTTKDNYFIQEIQVINEELFIMTNRGVYIYEIENDKFIFKRKMLDGVSTTDVIQDKNDNLWITTQHEGIHVFPNLDFKSNLKLTEKNGLRKMLKGKPNEIFLIGKKNEFFLYNTISNSVKKLNYPDFEDIKYVFYNTSRSNYFIQGSRQVQSFSLVDDKIKLLKSYNNLNAKDHHYLTNDSLLIATGNKSILLNINSVNNNWDNSHLISTTRTYSCFSDKNSNNYYISGVKGLFHYDKDLKPKKEITWKNHSIYIRDIISTKDGTIWCLSFKNGFYKIVDNKIVKQYTSEEGLLSNINSFFREDTRNNSIWIAGEKGIQEFNYKKETFQNLTKKNGIPSYEFTGLEIIEDRLYASTSQELFSFDTKTVFDANKVLKPSPYFSFVSIDNVQENLAKSYSIPTDGKKVEIGFNTNGFLSSENILYEYRLLDKSDKNKDWEKETSKSNKVIFNKLPQGKYTFQLRAKKGDVYSDIQEIQFNVKGVFYKQWWFFLGLTIIIGFLIWNYFNRKNNELKEKQKLIIDKQSKELENIFLKLESLRSQMNPHFIFNALNSIQDYILNNEKKLARTYLVKFSRLIRMYLEHSQRDKISLEEELAALNFYLELEKDRFQDSFSYQIIVDEKLDKELVGIPTFLIQPYVENAIKHGLLHKKENRKLEIKFSINNQSNILHCSIDDNGVGRVTSNEINQRKAFKPVSFSSEANAKRIDLLNKTRKYPIKLEIKDKYNDALESQGTLVNIDIPLEN
ncbi:histidine kinase [Tenacibaculum sp. MEBiC06402]|uniref:sensor histidine kinase n=1 Tax=unclassified Tenacibaculum TaxID=2635139 RepID=UPI003B9C6EDC